MMMMMMIIIMTNCSIYTLSERGWTEGVFFNRTLIKSSTLMDGLIWAAFWTTPTGFRSVFACFCQQTGCEPIKLAGCGGGGGGGGGGGARARADSDLVSGMAGGRGGIWLDKIATVGAWGFACPRSILRSSVSTFVLYDSSSDSSCLTRFSKRAGAAAASAESTDRTPSREMDVSTRTVRLSASGMNFRPVNRYWSHFHLDITEAAADESDTLTLWIVDRRLYLYLRFHLLWCAGLPIALSSADSSAG